MTSLVLYCHNEDISNGMIHNLKEREDPKVQIQMIPIPGIWHKADDAIFAFYVKCINNFTLSEFLPTFHHFFSQCIWTFKFKGLYHHIHIYHINGGLRGTNTNRMAPS